MSDIDAVVQGLTTRLTTGMAGTAIGGRFFSYAVDAVNPPTGIVLPAPTDFVTYDRTFDGQDDYSILVKILMGSADDRSGQRELLSYFDRTGSTSLYAAIAADTTLGGSVAMITSLRGSAYGDVEWNGVVFFGAELLLECGS